LKFKKFDITAQKIVVRNTRVQNVTFCEKKSRAYNSFYSSDVNLYIRRTLQRPVRHV